MAALLLLRKLLYLSLGKKSIDKSFDEVFIFRAELLHLLKLFEQFLVGLDLAHELLGHGLQAVVRQLDRSDLIHVPPAGRFPRIENDAQHMSNRVATATGRTDMIRPTYTIVRTVDGEYKRIAYPIDPRQAIQWNKNKKY